MSLTNSFHAVGFLLYAAIIMTVVFVIIFHFIPKYGQPHIMAYIGVCSLVGSLSVCMWSMIQINNQWLSRGERPEIGVMTGHEC